MSFIKKKKKNQTKRVYGRDCTLCAGIDGVDTEKPSKEPSHINGYETDAEWKEKCKI